MIPIGHGREKKMEMKKRTKRGRFPSLSNRRSSAYTRGCCGSEAAEAGRL
jgi:hypothetical protein